MLYITQNNSKKMLFRLDKIFFEGDKRKNKMQRKDDLNSKNKTSQTFLIHRKRMKKPKNSKTKEFPS